MESLKSPPLVLESIHCSEMYADEIKKELSGQSSDNFWTSIFPPDAKYQWICPNITGIELNGNEKFFMANIVSCPYAREHLPDATPYANKDDECYSWDQIEAETKFEVQTQAIASNFVP